MLEQLGILFDFSEGRNELKMGHLRKKEMKNKHCKHVVVLGCTCSSQELVEM